MTTATPIRPLDAPFLQSKFQSGLKYEQYLQSDPDKAARWRDFHNQVALKPEQKKLVEGFTREMNILISSGIWCGDCAQQCPLIERIAEANPSKITTRYVDRDEHRDLSEQIKICGGLRVPAVLFLAEDFEFVSLLGDKTLTRYRAAAAKQLGASCPLPGSPVPQDEINATLQDWLNEFERVQLLLRLSPRLREKHGD